MATITVPRVPDTQSAAALAAGYGSASTANLSTTQTGNGASTNVVDRAFATGAALVVITTTIGATPTCTYAIQGSPDGTNWFNVAYADSGTPTTISVATFAITTATTVYKIVQPDIPVRYLRLNYTANTNVTNTADIWIT